MEREIAAKKYILAHDLGTSGDKATLFSTSGELIKSHVVSYDVNFFNGNYAEQNPLDWWQAVCESTKEILKDIKEEEVAAVSFSGQMQGCILVNREGEVLRPGIIWADQRATKQAAKLEEKIGYDEMYEITGHRVGPSCSIEKLMWVKENEPDIYHETYKMLQAKDYIIYRLTGEFVTDYSDASGTHAFDLKYRTWSERIIEAAEIDVEKLPKLLNSTDIVGGVTKEASRECGLLPGTPIVCGGGDGPCSTVGAGCIGDGELFTTFGTSAWIGGTMKDPFLDEDKTLFCFAHVIPDRYMPCGTMQAAGSSYAYIKNALCKPETEKAKREGINPYDLLNKMIEESPPGAKNLIFLPYMLGERSPRWNPDTSGSFIGIKMDHEKKDYVRAVIEGVAFNLELILQAYRRYVKVNKMILTGGGAKGEVVGQILSDVLNVELKKPNHVEEATSIGAAVIAGVGAGIFPGFEEVKRFLKFQDSHKQVSENVEIYSKMKPVFDHSYTALLNIFNELKELS